MLHKGKRTTRRARSSRRLGSCAARRSAVSAGVLFCIYRVPCVGAARDGHVHYSYITQCSPLELQHTSHSCTVYIHIRIQPRARRSASTSHGRYRLYCVRPNTVFEKRETSKANRPSPLLGRATLNLRKRLEVADHFLGSPRKGEKGCRFLRILASQEKTTSRALTHKVSLATQCSRALRVLYGCTHARHAFRAFALLHSCHRCG